MFSTPTQHEFLIHATITCMKPGSLHIVKKELMLSLCIMAMLVFLRRVNDTPFDVADWKICRNEVGHYQMKVPRIWHVYGTASYSEGPAAQFDSDCTGRLVVLSAQSRILSENPTLSEMEGILRVRYDTQGDLKGSYLEGVSDLDTLVINLGPDLPRMKRGFLDGEASVSWELDGIITTKSFHDGILYTLELKQVAPELHNSIVDSFEFI